MERVVCEVCGKNREPSLEFPGFCEPCADQYGEYTDMEKVEKIHRKPKRYDERER